MLIIKYKIKILIWKLYNKFNGFFIRFIEKISLRILKYLTIQGLYALGVNTIIYYDIIELNESLEKLLKFSLFIGLSTASVYHYYKFYDLSWLKLKKKFKKEEAVENSGDNNIEIESDFNNIPIDLGPSSELLKPVKKEVFFYIEDKDPRTHIVDIGGLNDPDNLERAYLFKAILLNLIAWWIKNGG